jgi:hypothetical protein
VCQVTIDTWESGSSLPSLPIANVAVRANIVSE